MRYAGEISSGLDVEQVLTREDVYKVHVETINPDVPPMDDFPPFIPESSLYRVASVYQGRLIVVLCLW